MESTPQITLYQFQLCPFCHKVRAALELKGLAYRMVEVAPGSKRELPPLPEGAPRKVPVIQVDGEVIWDSTTILMRLDDIAPSAARRLLPQGGEERAAAVTLEEWVDANLIPSLPTVIYDTWANAMRAAQITARESNFTLLQSLKVRVGGSLIMRLIAKRILKRVGRSDGHAWVRECLDEVEARLAGRAFVGGEAPSVADAALHGALRCVEEFPVFSQLGERPSLRAWYARVSELRAAGRRA